MSPRQEHPFVNRRAYRSAIAAFGVATVGSVVAIVGYWTHGSNRQLGVGLALTLGGIGFGLVSWAKYLDLDEHVVQERESLRLDPGSKQGLQEMIGVSRATVTRRPLLLSLIGAAGAALVAAFVGPLASLGPRPKGERKHTAWANGKRLVTADGQPVSAASARVDQLVTVFPEGDTATDDSQVVLLQVRPELLSEATVAAGAVQGWVAYSKICTHAGCSVGLFGVDNRPPNVLRQLVCPCHQSIFDPLDGARPMGGPAPRSLPQLPLAVDTDGYLIATADFDRPVGPPTWNEA